MSQPLLVELFLENARIRGLCTQVEERTRLVDILNGTEEAFHLGEAKVSLGPGAPRDLPNLNVEKRAIVVAIPHETEEQLRKRALMRMAGGAAPTKPAHLTMLVPPFVIEGTAHLNPSVGTLRGNLHAETGLFHRFVTMTDAKLVLPNGTAIEAPVLFVNRDLIAAMSSGVESNALAKLGA
jgi:hypothetical protein